MNQMIFPFQPKWQLANPQYDDCSYQLNPKQPSCKKVSRSYGENDVSSKMAAKKWL